MKLVERITRAEAMRMTGIKDYRTFNKYAKLWKLETYWGTKGDMFSREEVGKCNNMPKSKLKQDLFEMNKLRQINWKYLTLFKWRFWN